MKFLPKTGLKYALLKYAFIAVFALVYAGCDSDDPDDDGPGEEELITRVTVTLTPMDAGAVVTAEATDPDGDGTDFQIDSITLTAGATYTGNIQVFDDLNNENITEEVEEEDAEHQFFYFPAGGVADRITVTYDDQDENGLPVGLSFTVAVTAGDAATGTMRVVLSHYDEGPKDGVNLSDESDVDVEFPVTIAP